MVQYTCFCLMVIFLFFMQNYWTVPECLLFKHTMAYDGFCHTDDKPVFLCVCTGAMSTNVDVL